MSKRFRLVFASACAVLCMLLCTLYASHVRQEADRVRSEAIERYGGEVVSLVVATSPLEPGDVVSKSNVTTRDWLVDMVPEGAITDMDKVLGQEVGVPAAKGAPLTDVNFRADETMAEVPKGHVALTLAITDKLGVPRTIAQGSLLEAFAVNDEGTVKIAEDMHVLSKPSATASLSGAQITVSVRPDDVAAVLEASAEGTLRLVVPADDAAGEATDSAGDDDAPAELPEDAAGGEADEGEADASGAAAAADGADSGETADGGSAASGAADTSAAAGNASAGVITVLHAHATPLFSGAVSAGTPRGGEVR